MKQRILVCEDNEGIIDVIRIVLEEKGFHIITLSSGDTVLETVKKENPSLILMDIWMPGLNGDDVTRILKQDSETKDIPVIIVSASRDAEEVAKTVGAEGALKKPFDIADLEAVVEKYIPSEA